jgi:hypothetical protein
MGHRQMKNMGGPDVSAAQTIKAEPVSERMTGTSPETIRRWTGWATYDSRHRGALLFELRKMPLSSSIPILMDIAENDSNPKVKEYALTELRRMFDKQYMPNDVLEELGRDEGFRRLVAGKRFIEEKDVTSLATERRKDAESKKIMEEKLKTASSKPMSKEEADAHPLLQARKVSGFGEYERDDWR